MNREVVLGVALFTIVVLAVANGFGYYQISKLQSQISELENQNSQLQNQNSELQSQNRFPYLVTALGSTYTWSPNSNGDRVYYLYIEGTVTNEGDGTAYNCKLKIVTNSLKDTFTDYYKFNTLAPGEQVTVDTHLYHVDLVNWTITPEYTNNP
jgi:uncharacterized protein (UPF0333 family)